MAIRYDGIEFDTVKELVEYKKLNKVTAEEAVVVKVKEKVTDEVVEGKKSNSWKSREDDILKNAINLCNSKKRISKDIMRGIYKMLPGRTQSAIKTRVSVLKKGVVKADNKIYSKDEIKKILEFYKERNWNLGSGEFDKLTKMLPNRTVGSLSFKAHELRKKYMIKKKATVPETFDESRIKMAKHSTKSKESYEFPKIYPLADTAHKVFETMLTDIIARKGKISMFDAQNHLQVSGDVEWCGRVWKEFVTQFQMNLPKIRKVLIMKKPQNLKVVIEGGFHYIVYQD